MIFVIKIGIAEKDGTTIKLLRELLSDGGSCVRCITHCRCDKNSLAAIDADYLLMPADILRTEFDLVLSVNPDLCPSGIETKYLLENRDEPNERCAPLPADIRISFGMGSECDITASSIESADGETSLSCCVRRRIDGFLGNSADIGEYTFRIYGSNPPVSSVLGAAAAYIMCKNTKKGETLLLY